MKVRKNVFLIGIDIGTTGCKTGLYEVSGDLISKAYEKYPMITQKNGLAEENPKHWWIAAGKTIKEVVKKSGIDPKNVVGIGVSGTNACVAVDKNGKILRNAIMQVDRRTTSQCSWLKEKIGEETIFNISGNRIAPGSFSAPIMLWIKDNQPEIFRKTYKFLSPTGIIVQKLTDEFVIDWTRAATTLLFEILSKKWSERICEETGIPIDKLPELCPPTKIVGEVTTEASRITGLEKGTPVIAGCMDTVASALGSGLIEEGQTSIVLGTVGRICLILEKPFFDKRFLNTCYITSDKWLAIAAVNSVGLTLRWFKKCLGQFEVTKAKEDGVTPYEIFDREAEESPPGANSLLYLPYICGERSPIWDPYAKGVIFGLDISHKKSDLIRALLEGVAYALRDNLEIMEKNMQRPIKEIYASGGGAKSQIWLKIISNVLQKNILQLNIFETETLGDALIAGFGTGIYKNLQDIRSYVAQVAHSYEPQLEYSSLYEGLFSLYKKLYTSLKEDFLSLHSL